MLVSWASATCASAPADALYAAGVTAAARSLGDEHAVGADDLGGADDRAEVARIGDVVERDDERVAAWTCGVGEDGRRASAYR